MKYSYSPEIQINKSKRYLKSGVVRCYVLKRTQMRYPTSVTPQTGN